MSNPPTKKQKTTNQLPTRDEQKQLQQVEILMKTNLFHLQVKELLDQISCKDKLSTKKLDQWMTNLESDLLSQAKYTCNSRVISTSWVDSLSYEGLNFVNSNVEITYGTPTQVTPIGSFAYNTGTAPFYTIDIAVTMPAECIQAK